MDILLFIIMLLLAFICLVAAMISVLAIVLSFIKEYKYSKKTKII
nr:MAG TPA: hypothetical protein [Crassvirales sp.]